VSRDASSPTPEQLILLRRNLTDYFGEDDLRELCSEMGIDYERLRGHSKAVKASELARYLAARGRVQEFVASATRLRPAVSWGDLGRAGSRGGQPASSKGIRPASVWLGWLAVLIAAAGFAFVLSGGLRRGEQATAPTLPPDTPSPPPMTSTLAPTLTPTVAAVTATPQWTPAPPTGTPTPTASQTPKPAPTRTTTPRPLAGTSAPRVVTLLAPADSTCEKSSVITFQWTGATLRPDESFTVAIIPVEVVKGGCTSNYVKGVQYSPPLRDLEWTTDIRAPSRSPVACAGQIEWTVYIRSAAGDLTQVAPIQHFEWDPSGCSQ
jgi:Effector-associated domain 7